MKKTRGFSLIELMIAVAIVGVLVAISYPSYTNSLIKGNRAAAKSYLMEIAQKEQQFLLDSRAYVAYADVAALAAAGLAPPPEVTKFYTLAVAVVIGPPPTFTVTATPIAGKRQEPDGWLNINQAGTKDSQFPDKW